MRKALFSVLFILFAGIFSCNAQLQKITSYYNNDSSLVNEQYFVLSSDTDIKDSLYNNYSKEGKLLKKGFYNKGDKMGEWVHFFPDRQIKSSGYYNMNKQFCGCHFSYNINGEIEQVDYYIDDIAYNDSIQVQEEFVRKLVEALHTTGFDVYDIMQEKFLSLQTMFAKYDSIENADEKLVFGHRIVQSGYFFKEWFNSFKSERELLLKSKSVMDAFTADIDKDYFDLLMNPIVENADSLLNSDNIIFVLDDGSKIRKEFIQISGLISEIEIIEPQITSGLSELESNYKDEFPEFYKSELDQFSKKHDDYKQEENLQIKISLGNEIVSLIEKMKADFEKLTNLSESIDEKLNKLEKVYKEKFPVDYQAEEELINSDYAGFKASTQLQEKIELGQIVLKHIETSYINFYTVDSMDIVIAEEFKSIREGYLQSFAAIYGKEIKPVANSIAGFNRTKGLEIKIMTGQNILDTIHYFDAAYTRFIDIDKALKERYSKLQSNFKEGYRAIYKNEVAQMDKLIKNYNVNGRSKSKLDVGNNIMEKIIELENNYSEIGKQSDEIGNRYTAVSEKFKSDFSPVYKYTLCTYDDKKENYEKSLNCKTYLEKGKAFLEEVTILEEKYDEISKQYSSIIEILSKVEGLYQIDFPEIFDTEIKEERSKIEDYNDEGFIEKKLQTGEFIIEKLKILQKIFPQLKEENTKINNEFPGLAEEYREYFSVLYKTYIEPLEDDEKNYQKTGYHAPKLTLSNRIVVEIDELRAKYDLFKIQNDKLLGKYDEFTYNYKDRKQVKRMYKKGRWAYVELKDAYDNETNFEKKEKKGKKIELMLQQFISLSSKDNTIINDEIKSTKTVNDVLKVIGIN